MQVNNTAKRRIENKQCVRCGAQDERTIDGKRLCGKCAKCAQELQQSYRLKNKKNKTNIKPYKPLCKHKGKCKYAMYDGGGKVCAFLLITGEPRGIAADKCEKWREAK